ncbi:TolC family protein [Ectothiorhodospira shaposhnikovii]|uniref:TolC family protein n=1 Tax=Ectothiorhodospira shaposhnikovii TaxID=1054 RepID=UPI001EE8FC09|nr:TolC family protein [Ectothiorhodospira shaposhnikovii]MCG5514356.1 TolC family protein [Ectothiorhodospira shaposhnikovii]
MRLLPLTLVLIPCFLPWPAFADAWEDLVESWWTPVLVDADQEIALRNAVAEAVRLQPSLRREQARREELGEGVREVRAEWLPRIHVGLEQRSSLSHTERRAFDSGSRVGAVAGVSQRLYDFGASSGRLQAARGRLMAQEWHTRAMTEQFVLDALGAHYDLARHQAHQTLADINLARHEAIEARVLERVAGGAGSRADQLRAQSRVADARARQVAVSGRRQQAAAIYEAWFFSRPGPLPRPQFEFSPWLMADLTTAQATADNPVLHEALARIEAGRGERRAAAGERWPQLRLDLQGRRFDVDRSDQGDTDLALLVTVDYALYNGGAAGARLAQARERERQAHWERQALERELMHQWHGAEAEVRALGSELAAQYQAFQADQAAVLAYEAQFSIGRRSLNDLLDAQRDLFQTSLRLVDLRVALDLARFRQLAVAGALLDALQIDAVTPSQSMGAGMDE